MLVKGSHSRLTTTHFYTDGSRFRAVSRESRAVSVTVGSEEWVVLLSISTLTYGPLP